MTRLHCGTIAPGLKVLAIGALFSCGGGPTEPPNDGTTSITLTSGLQFSPADLTVDPGTTVRWVISSSTFHTITPSSIQQQGGWNRATTTASGTVLTHTFSVPGQVYNYFCEVHSGMVGVVRVR